MRPLRTLTLVAALVLVASSSRAEGPEPAVGFVAGGSAFFAGFAAGAVLIGTSNGNGAQNNAGWLTIDAGFALAPLLSHALVGEWTRALVFTATPAVVLAATATLLAIHPATIEHGELSDQRVTWGLFGLGLLSGVVGVVDASLAESRSRRARGVAISPLLGPGQVGIGIGGLL